MDGLSLDIFSEKLSKLKSLLPDAFTENTIDWEKLKAALGDDLNFSQERYHLNWAGKSEVFRVLQQRTTATLNPDKSNSVNYDSTENIFIEGENLEVLKVLQKSYFNKIKMIYIDPPYNTGSDSFIYPDRFSESKEEYLKRIGDKDEDGFLLKEGMFRKNSKDSGHYHSNWLSMMYPRLYLARNLLRDDGVIFVSIDDNEVHNLRLIMNEIFGEENFLASIVWQKKYAASNDVRGIAAMHDYIIAYKKSHLFERNLFPRTEKQDALYKYDDNDGRGLWRSDNLLVKSFQADYVFPITNPLTNKEYFPPKGSCWRANQNTIDQWIKENRIFFGKDGKGAPQLKRYLNEVQQGIVPTSWWSFQDAGHNDEANKELKNIFETKAPFETPKPTKLISRLLQIATNPNQGELILDFFAGSGTTAHAAMALNKEDGGNRKFILVQLPEKIEESSEAFNAGYLTIADICRDRIKKVITKLNAPSPDNPSLFKKDQSNKLDFGFKSYRLASSNFQIWRSDVIENVQDLEKMIEIFDEPTKPNSESENILVELMLKLGYQLTDQVEEVNNYYSIADGETILALKSIDEQMIVSILELKPKNVFVLDKLFNGNDQLKTNTALLMKDAEIEFKTV